MAKQFRYGAVEPWIFGGGSTPILAGSPDLIVRLTTVQKHFTKESAAVFRLERLVKAIRQFETSPMSILKPAISDASQYVRLRMLEHFFKERDAWGHKWAPIGVFTASIFFRAWGKTKWKLGVWSGGLLKRLLRPGRLGGGSFHRFTYDKASGAMRLTIGPRLANYKPALYFQTRGLGIRFGKVLGIRPARNFMALAKWERKATCNILARPFFNILREAAGGYPITRMVKEMGGPSGAFLMSESAATTGYGAADLAPIRKEMKEVSKTYNADQQLKAKAYEAKLYDARGVRREKRAADLLAADPTGEKARLRHRKELGRMGISQAALPKPHLLPERRARVSQQTTQQRLGLIETKQFKTYITYMRNKGYSTERIEKVLSKQLSRKIILGPPSKLLTGPPKRPSIAEKQLRLRQIRGIKQVRLRTVMKLPSKKITDRWDDDLESMQFMQRIDFNLSQMRRKRR